MSSKIILKKSGVTGKIPQNTDLEYGEVALNYADGKLYFKNTSNTVQSISAGALGVDSAATLALIDIHVDSDFITSRVGPIPTQGVDSSATISLINLYVDSDFITARVGPIPTQGVDSAATLALVDSAYIQARQLKDFVDSAKVMSIIDSAVTQSFINNLDVNAGTLDGKDGTFYLNYNNLTNTPVFPDSAFIASIAAQTPPDSATILGIVDSSFVQNLVSSEYVATIVDSAYVALRVGDFAQNFGTVAVVGDLSIDATTGGDTVTFAAGPGIELTTNPTTKRLTITNTTPTTGLDFGTIASPAGFSLDLGAI